MQCLSFSVSIDENNCKVKRLRQIEGMHNIFTLVHLITYIMSSSQSIDRIY